MSIPQNLAGSKPPVTAAKPMTSSAPTLKSEMGASKQEYTFLFDKQNYMLVFAGLGLIMLGFLLMAGGKSANPHEFHYDEIYSFRRITLAPIVLLAGVGLEIYAIMKKPRD